MKKPKVTDAILSKWRPSPDRTKNVINVSQYGLEATISRNSEIAFSIRMTVKGQRRRKVFGYFNAGQYGIDEALDDARKLRNQWRDEANGKVTVDPASIPTLLQLLDRYEAARKSGVDPIASHRGLPLPSGWEDYVKMMDKIYEPLLHRHLRAITREDIIECHANYLDKREVATGKRPHTSVRFTFNALKPVLVYARDMRWLAPEVLIGLRATTVKEESRERILTPREWQLIAPACDSLSNDTGLLPRFLLSTASRLTAACLAKWQDISTVNLGTMDKPRETLLWFLPAENMKQREAAMVPLIGDAARIVELLRARAGGEPKKGDYVFPENVRKAWLNNPDRWQKIIFERSGTKGWHRHDLRRTTATLLKFVGADMATVKRLLAHKEKDRSATGGYIQLSGNLEALGKVADALEKVQALQKDMEQGRVTAELRRLYAELDADDNVKQWMKEARISRETMMEVVPNGELPRAEVHELRKAK